MMEDLSLLREEDLTRRIQKKSEELEEIEEERDFVLKQTGLHVPGHLVKKYEAQCGSIKDSLTKLNLELELRKKK